MRSRTDTFLPYTPRSVYRLLPLYFACGSRRLNLGSFRFGRYAVRVRFYEFYGLLAHMFGLDYFNLGKILHCPINNALGCSFKFCNEMPVVKLVNAQTFTELVDDSADRFVFAF